MQTLENIRPASKDWKKIVAKYFPTQEKAGGLIKRGSAMKKPMKKMACGGKAMKKMASGGRVRGAGAATKGLKISKKMG